MTQKNHDIHSIFNIPKWEILQEHLATASNLAIITIDYKGTPVTAHSKCRPFCQSVRANPWLNKLCQTCDSRGGLEAVRTQAPYIYRCHFNLIDLAIPITVDDKYIGAVMAGQVKLADESASEGLEQVLSFPKNHMAAQHLKDHYEEFMDIPQMSLHDIERFSQFLFHLCGYLVDQFVYSGMPQKANARHAQEPAYNGFRNFYDLSRRKSDMESASILKPALDLLANMQGINYSQKEMSDLCHISPSYFSRLFVKEIGLNYSQYVTRVKLNQAKQLLEQTKRPIALISDELGFSSPGYFTKIFKKEEGITPHLYRKYYQDADSALEDSAHTDKERNGDFDAPSE